jgi:hypothetical protein
LKENSEARRALVEMRRSNTVNIDSPGLGPFEPDQITEQRAFATTRSAEDREDCSAPDLKRDVLHKHQVPPTNAQIVNGDVRPWE